MKLILLATSLLVLTGTAGCASAVKLENVAGTWSCPRIDGVCADIASLDAELIGTPAIRGVGNGAGQTAGAVGSIAVNASVDAMPQRSADEVARIVMAPSIDGAGHFHGARAIYAVMKPGEWVEGPIVAEPPIQTTTTLARQTEPPVESLQTNERQTANLPSSVGETTTRVVRRTIVNPPTPALRFAGEDHSDGE